MLPTVLPSNTNDVRVPRSKPQNAQGRGGSCGFMLLKSLKLRHLPPELTSHDAKPRAFGGNSILLVLKAKLGQAHSLWLVNPFG